MKQLKVILVAAMAISLAGCLLSGKPKALPAPPAPPQPVAPATPQELSIPQTQVDLPTPRQVPDQTAFNTAQPPEPAPEVESKPATPQPHVQRPVTVQAPKPVVETPPSEPPRPPIQEILPPDEEKRLLHSAEGHRADTIALLAVARRRHLTARENQKVEDINQFLKQSEQAESSKDMRSADQLAERAHILAKELQGGR